VTSETYARGGQQTSAGGVLVVLISVLSAVLVIAGIFYAAGTSGRHKAALAAAGCEPNLAPSGLQCTTVQMLAGRYTAITTAASQQLNTDGAAYIAGERHHLATAAAALTAEVAVENAFGTSLARFPFPPAIASAARALIVADRALARLTGEQARSSSLTRMRSFNGRAGAAAATVETDMRIVQKDLDLRPAASQEP
jgi:hypothetical protein